MHLHHIEVDTDERDALLLALAVLSLDRPGMLEFLQRVAGLVGGAGPNANGGESFHAGQRMFNTFRAFYAARLQDRPLV